MNANPQLTTEKLSISGIRCASCVQLIEYRMRKTQGVKEFRIHPTTQIATIVFDGTQLSEKRIIQSINDLGYPTFPAHQSLDELAKKEKKMNLWRIFVAGFAMMQVMMYAFPAYLVGEVDSMGDLTPDQDTLFKWASLILTVPVILFSSVPFFQSAWRDLKHKSIGMDVPVSLGIILTFLASCWNTIDGGHVYFDSVNMFVLLLLIARYIENQVKNKTSETLKVLTQLEVQYAKRLPRYPDSTDSENIEFNDLQLNDVLLVAAGEQIPCDGMVLEGQSEVDESLMTGESHPIRKQKSDQVMAGTINTQGRLIIQVQKVGQATQLAHIIGSMEKASQEKPKLIQIADKHAHHFLYAILIIALLSGIGWYGVDSRKALWVAISVIVVTCPCALSLATPGVMSAAIGQLAKHGLLVTNGKVIEVLANATHFVFDKTGTLTHGRMQVVYSMNSVNSMNGKATSLSNVFWLQYANILYTLSQASLHPVSKAVHEEAIKQVKTIKAVDEKHIQQCEEIIGKGVQAIINHKYFRLGNAEFAFEICENEEARLAAQHVLAQHPDKTVSILANEQAILALFFLQDTLREDADKMVSMLHSQGKQVALFSGDKPEVVSATAQACGITQYQAQLKPEDKLKLIQSLQKQGAKVVMIGDGMNDGPALAIADLSIVMGQGAPISQTRSDALLVSNQLSHLGYAMSLSKKAYSLIKQNLAWALLYNLIAIPLAVLGYLEPWHAELGMVMSSFIVVMNGLRVFRVKSEW